MNYLIEPCCAARHLMQLRDAIGKDGTKEFGGFGDLSLTELLPAMLARYNETELLIVAPTLPDQAADVIARWMNQQWPRRDGRGKMDTISHLTVISNLSRRKSPTASQWLKDNPFGDRLTLVSKQQDDTVILLPDFAIVGPVNMRYGEPFTATATTNPERIDELWKKYSMGEGTDAVAADETEESVVTEVSENPAEGREPAVGEAGVQDASASDGWPFPTETDPGTV